MPKSKKKSGPGCGDEITPDSQHAQHNELEKGYERDGPESGDEANNSESDDGTDGPGVRERLAVMETKVKMVDKLLGINLPKDEPEAHGDSDNFDSDDDGVNNGRQSLLEDWSLLLKLVKLRYERIEWGRKVRRCERQAAKQKASQGQNAAVEPEFAKQISIEAFLKGKPARLTRVDWETFVQPKGDLMGSILSPIDVVIGEPEAQLMLQLTARLGRAKGKPSTHRPTEKASETKVDAPPGQQSLPERIRIHSSQLFALFERSIAADRAWRVANDSSMSFMRPFKTLVYYEQPLRDLLARLEKRFENFSETEDKPPSSGREESVGADTLAQAASDTATAVDLDGEPETGGEKRPSLSGMGTTTGAGGPQVDDNSDKDKDEDREDNEAQDSIVTITTLLHLRCLMTFFDEEIKPRIEHIGSDKCRKVLFHDLWHLFKPGDEVVDQSEKQAYRVIQVQTPRHNVVDPWVRWYGQQRDSSDDEKDKDEDPVIIHCAYIDFDGKMFGPVSKGFKIPTFGRPRDVKALPIYPLRFAKNPNLRQDLIKRGKMLLDVSKFKSMYYIGFSLDTRDEIDSQVVVDFNEALADDSREWEPTIEPIRTAPEDRKDKICEAACCLHQAVCVDDCIDSNLTEKFVKSLIPESSFRAPSLILSPRSLEETTGPDNEPTDAEFLVMTYRVFGFVLRSRKWAQLDLTFLSYENADARKSTRNAFDRLELPAGHREMVKSLVTQHFRDKQVAFNNDDQTDIVRGKGKGLILLLHGAPGVGKTTTAEGIAELFEKPLFQMTCGDLGTTAREVETQLEKNFALASRWGCILLLDEADVFLSARERKDFERNGLVAVFLRVLEYYAGILFLTTNRIGDFDEAFASRIHMSLYYPELDEDKTRKVFKLNLDIIQDRFKRQHRKITFDVTSIDDFATEHFRRHVYNRWNGRQIRNACQTALALAEFDTYDGAIDGEMDRNAVVELQLKYFKTVQTAYLDFGKYLGRIRGAPGDRRAVDFGLRARHGTPYETTPSRFSRRSEGFETGGYELGEEDRHAASVRQHYARDDPFQPLVNQGFAAGPGANMGMYGQSAPQGQPMGSMGFENQQFPQHNQQFPQQNQQFQQQGQQFSQQSQVDPRLWPQHMGFQRGPGFGAYSQGLGFGPNSQSGLRDVQQGVNVQGMGSQDAPGSMGHAPVPAAQPGSGQAGGPAGLGNSPSPSGMRRDVS